MIQDLKVKIVKSVWTNYGIEIAFEAQILLDNGKQLTMKREFTINEKEENEEMVKKKILGKIQSEISDALGKDFARGMLGKEYKNEDFAFSNIFSKKG